jgi:hypothetical protein
LNIQTPNVKKNLQNQNDILSKNFSNLEREKIILLRQIDDLQEDFPRSLTEKEYLIEEISKN